MGWKVRCNENCFDISQVVLESLLNTCWRRLKRIYVQSPWHDSDARAASAPAEIQALAALAEPRLHVLVLSVGVAGHSSKGSNVDEVRAKNKHAENQALAASGDLLETVPATRFLLGGLLSALIYFEAFEGRRRQHKRMCLVHVRMKRSEKGCGGALEDGRASSKSPRAHKTGSSCLPGHEYRSVERFGFRRCVQSDGIQWGHGWGVERDACRTRA